MPLVRRGPGLVGTAARAGVAMGVAGRVQHRQQMRWAEQGELPGQQVAAAPAAPTPAAPAQPDYAAQLEQLAQLRDQGVITAEDFEAKKKQILGI
jgi:membrane protease subunit (stomatin/prohibitin family)